MRRSVKITQGFISIEQNIKEPISDCISSLLLKVKRFSDLFYNEFSSEFKSLFYSSNFSLFTIKCTTRGIELQRKEKLCKQTPSNAETRNKYFGNLSLSIRYSLLTHSCLPVFCLMKSCMLKKQRLKITQLGKERFIKVNELKLTQVELF